MKYVSFKNDLGINVLIRASLKKNFSFERIRIGCSNYFTCLLNGKVVHFGPKRTAKGYVRIQDVAVSKKEEDSFSISILYYGFSSFDIEFQPFFFGIEFYKDGKLVGTSDDLLFEKDESYLSDSCKYSFQRGLVERYRFSRKKSFSTLEMEEIAPLIELQSVDTCCRYEEVTPKLLKISPFQGFDEIKDTPYLLYDSLKSLNRFNVRKEVLSLAKSEYYSSLYSLERERTGLLHVKANFKKRTKIYILFDEVMPGGKWIYARSNCNDVIEVELDGASCDFYTKVPYSLKYIRVLKEDAVMDVSVSLIAIENGSLTDSLKIDDPQVRKVYEAAKNTFAQNSFDLFTDCPGRERAGWLCDSYFMGFAAKQLMGDRRLEREFLENYILSSCSDIPEKMLPMCYPSDHKDGTFIPNWAMWFVLELFAYYCDTKDEALLSLAKKRVFDLVSFFQGYENEIGLLENLPGWVFIEWSKANDFISGVSFPSNMLYAQMLGEVGKYYDSPSLLEQSKRLKNVIYKHSFFDGFYHDHAQRDKEGNLETISEDVSETAQYYALFLKMPSSKDYRKKMIRDFGMNVKANPLNIAKSNVFIGYFLRMFYLLREKEYRTLLKEATPYFYRMSEETSTLWEKDTETASCNHGFASCLSYVIAECFKNKS